MADLQITNVEPEPPKGHLPNSNIGGNTTSEQTSPTGVQAAADGGIGPEDEKREITEEECQGHLGFQWSDQKKWFILGIIAWIQISMNFNTSLIFNAIPGIMEEFDVAHLQARCAPALFLITYAFGCELWAPWSEELGRWPVLQLSLFFVNVFQLPVALAPNFSYILIGRALGGLSSAGGSVTLGLIADMFDTDTHQEAVAFVTHASVLGSVLGPIAGGFIEEYLNWRWCIWVQLIFGVAVQLLHWTIPETRPASLMNKVAQRRRKETPGENTWGPDEVSPLRERLTFAEVRTTWLRPFKMFFTEPIVSVLSLLSGWADGLIFLCFYSFTLVYKQWDFTASQVGWAFAPIGIGYLLGLALIIPAVRRNKREREAKPNDDRAQFESRLRFLLWTAPLLPIGLLGFALTIRGPPIHWIGSMVFAAMIGIANYAIYMTTIDYMICAYGRYSASATGGNGFARDFIAGVLTLLGEPFFTQIGADKGKNLEFAVMILFGISFLLVGAVYVVYWKGPVLRQRSPFAQKLANEREEAEEHEESKLGVETLSICHGTDNLPLVAAAPKRLSNNRAYSHNSRFFGETRVTPLPTPRATPAASRANSPSNVNRRAMSA
ncbi:major facilitator superfamily transporter [Colletotrichum sojae]|uniref:Major facilitator superfamily transporter n=1 Tax=Colletotrichum sojae TaxID=2175907 RepID=A0A8H6ILY7_9PEZI|nr:major facilitator superfamily transporter [Colletotrichum sojae]